MARTPVKRRRAGCNDLGAIQGSSGQPGPISNEERHHVEAPSATYNSTASWREHLGPPPPSTALRPPARPAPKGQGQRFRSSCAPAELKGYYGSTRSSEETYHRVKNEGAVAEPDRLLERAWDMIVSRAKFARTLAAADRRNGHIALTA